MPSSSISGWLGMPATATSIARAPDACAVLEAIDLERRHNISFWNAQIVVAAQKAGAAVIHSEDFTAGRKFGPVQIQNPFAEG